VTIIDTGKAYEGVSDQSKKTDELIGKIYDSATNPGEWFDLVEAIAHYTQPETTEDGLEIYRPPELVETIISHLERAARNNEYIHVLEDQKQTLNTIYNNMPWPMLMLDSKMNVLDANQAAHQFLNVSAPVSITVDGHVHFQDRDLKAALQRLLNMETGRDVQILNSATSGLSLLCTPLAKSDAPGAISQLRAVVWVISNENKIVPSADIIQSVFGLTLAEARLLNLLCSQGSLNECAAQLDVSVHTVRSQLKSIMAKTHVTSQVQLVSKTMGQSFLQAATKQLSVVVEEVERTVLLPDGRVLSWFEYGNSQGRVVLTLDGIGGGTPHHSQHDSWYKSKNLRVINIIRPGYGVSTAKPNLQFVEFIEDIKFLIKHLSIHRPVMATYCIGSAYALCAAAKVPDLFERLGILGPTVPLEHWEIEKLDLMHKLFLRMYRTSPKIFSMFMRLAMRGLQRNPEKGYAKIATSLGGRDQELLEDPVIRKRTIEQIQARKYQGSEMLVNEYQNSQESWGVDLNKITMPTLMWHGEADPTISIGSARSMAAAIPNIIFKSFPGHGRLLVHDLWEDFLENLLEL